MPQFKVSLRFVLLGSAAMSCLLGVLGATTNVFVRSSVFSLRQMGVHVLIVRHDEVSRDVPFWKSDVEYCVDVLGISRARTADVAWHIRQLDRIDDLIIEKTDPALIFRVLPECSCVRYLEVDDVSLSSTDLSILPKVRGLRALYLGSKVDASLLLSQFDLAEIESLGLVCDVSDAEVEQIACAPVLMHLSLSGDLSHVSDSGWNAIGRMSQLQVLSLKNAAFKHGQLDHLAKLQKLERLRLSFSAFPEEDLESLRARLPNCFISYQPQRL